MRAILVDPAQRTIVLTEVHSDVGFIGDCFASYPRMAVRFPNGDVLLAAPTDVTEALRRPFSSADIIVIEGV